MGFVECKASNAGNTIKMATKLVVHNGTVVSVHGSDRRLGYHNNSARDFSWFFLRMKTHKMVYPNQPTTRKKINTTSSISYKYSSCQTDEGYLEMLAQGERYDQWSFPKTPIFENPSRS